MQTGTTCQSYNIGKVYISSTLPSTRTSIEISQINKVITIMSLWFFCIDRQNITSNDLWVDGIHLTNSGEATLARDFVEKVNGLLC